MTPYSERRHKGYYSETGELPASTTTDSLGGLGAPAAVAEEEPEAAEDIEDTQDFTLDDMTKSELLEKAKELGVSPANAAMNKDELIAGIEEQQS